MALIRLLSSTLRPDLARIFASEERVVCVCEKCGTAFRVSTKERAESAEGADRIALATTKGSREGVFKREMSELGEFDRRPRRIESMSLALWR